MKDAEYFELSALRADLENFSHRFSQIYTDNIIVLQFKNLCSSVSQNGNSYTIKLIEFEVPKPGLSD